MIGPFNRPQKTMGKECGLNVSSHLWGGALHDKIQNGCVGDYDLCWSVQFNEKLRKFTGVGVFISLGPISMLKCVRGEPRKFYFIE